MALSITCSLTNQRLTCTWTELSNSADNYRGELLGALCCSLLLKAASMTPAAYKAPPLLRYCDNMGVVKHGNRVYPRLKDKQAHADIIRLFTSINCQLPFKSKYAWVQSHTDGKNARQRRLSAIERDNNRVDALAKTALVHGIMARDFISSDFPFETIRVKTSSQKLTGSIHPFILSHHGRRVAKQVFGFGKRGKKLVNKDDFDYVYWDAFPAALK